MGIEEYKGHVLDVLIEASRTERIGRIAHNTLQQCYPQGLAVPAPDALHYTLGKFSRHLVWNQRRAPEQILDTDEGVGREIVLSDTNKLEGIKEDTTIFKFLPPFDMDRAKSRKQPQISLTTWKPPSRATKHLCKFLTPGAREGGNQPIFRRCPYPHP